MSAFPRDYKTGSGTGPSVTVARPTLQPGDVLWALQASTGPLDAMHITGWNEYTALADSLFGALRVKLWRRTVTSADTAVSSYGFGQQPSTAGTVIIVSVASADPLLPVKLATLANASVTGGVTSPSVPPASATHLELRFTALLPESGGGQITDAPDGYQSRGLAAAGTLSSAAASRLIASSTPSGSKTFPATGGGYGIGISLSIPSGAAEPEQPPAPPFTPGKGSALYQYVFRRLLGGDYLGHLDLAGVTFDKRILQPGAFQATIPIPSRKVGDQVAEIIPRDETILDRGPGVITVEIYRAGECWGQYWITGAKPGRSRRGTPAIRLRGSTLDAYLNHVELQADRTYTSLDQIEIGRRLITHLQAQPSANIGLILQTGSSGVTRDRTYLASEGATYGRRLVELAEVDDGFEWTINIVPGSSGLERRWVWGYPLLGQQSPPLHVFVDSPNGGDVLEWDEDIDALRGGTRWRARGGTPDTGDASTVATPLISSVHTAADHLAAGWPRLDRTINKTSVVMQQTLEDWAAYWAATAPGALRVDSLTIALGAKPSFTPNSLGDSARIFFDNEWHLRHSRVRRIIGVGITPVSRDSGKEEAQLILEGREIE
ncbi:hypothetical protein ACIBEJ_48630 [Nonomuraea sp. NPDC050790]|uniref:hypothetical protein n=1 Tax=Nonomuraea sp. NPDC050790 TaxID=3364371 RepID=UPI0037AECB3C